jgi:hypothetical protein
MPVPFVDRCKHIVFPNVHIISFHWRITCVRMVSLYDWNIVCKKGQRTGHFVSWHDTYSLAQLTEIWVRPHMNSKLWRQTDKCTNSKRVGVRRHNTLTLKLYLHVVYHCNVWTLSIPVSNRKAEPRIKRSGWEIPQLRQQKKRSLFALKTEPHEHRNRTYRSKPSWKSGPHFFRGNVRTHSTVLAHTYMELLLCI